MKRVIILIAAVLVATVSALHAQVKFDEAALIDKIDKAKADTENPKKSGKAATWMNLGKAYLEASTTPTTGIYKGLDEMPAKLLLAPAEESTENIGGVEYKKWSFPYYDVYLADGKVAFWKNKKEIVPDAMGEATKAYMKAYEVEKDAASKIKSGLQRLVDTYKEQAQNDYAAQVYLDAAADFANAYELQKSPIIGVTDTISGFNAGFLYVIAGEFAKSQKYLEEALANNYENDGDTYYYLFHSYFGQQQYDKAKDVLLKGITKYSKNNKIVEGLMSLYATTGEDPNEVIPYVMKAIETDPSNPELYGGLGRVYHQLDNIPESIKAFEKALELAPNDFGTNYNLGYMYVKNADAMATEMSKKQITSQDEYNAELKKLNDAYALSIPLLEKAHQLNPTDVPTVELLKNVYFRLRDEDSKYMDGYNKFNELFKSLQ